VAGDTVDRYGVFSMKARIVIVAMASWGELGNILAARRLATCLNDVLDASIDVFKAEDIVPEFARIGARIEEIAKANVEWTTRLEQYRDSMRGLESVFYEGFETDHIVRGRLSSDIQRVGELIRTTKPDLLVGTKGLISRLLLAGLRHEPCGADVVNYVTNEGLLEIPLHRSAAVPHHFVPFESGCQYLVHHHGYSRHQVTSVGRLIRSPSPATVTSYPQTPVRAVIFSNRGGDSYLKPLAVALKHKHQVGIVFLGYNDARLTALAEDMAAQAGSLHCQISVRLDEQEYANCLGWLADGSLQLLVTKTGPNTMIEAAYFGVPQLLLNSGLPMEQWVAPFVERHGFGRGFDTMDQLTSVLEAWLAAPAEIITRHHAAKAFAAKCLNQEQIREATRDAFQRVLDGRQSRNYPDRPEGSPQKVLEI
jgi:hypothetical protein